MDTWITIIIVLAAGVYIARRFYKGMQKSGGCCIGCSSCGVSAHCGTAVTEQIEKTDGL